ncbi:hypothetical protein CEK28_10475 [Xenophilus sp. AP218F]|nr:hypothetical protein CEK28_10475 [Xenophilus sp. AP218F]
MIRLASIHRGDDGVALLPLEALGETHALRPAMARTLRKFYGLDTVPQSARRHAALFDEALDAALAAHPDLRRMSGQLWHCKTQTQNTRCQDPWLGALLARHGLRRWQAQSWSMTHCASGLALLHYLRRAPSAAPALLLTGEKSFHPATSRLSMGALGELPLVGVLREDAAGWRIADSAVRHLPAFYPSAAHLPEALAKEQQRIFPQALQRFLADFLAGREAPDRVLPYNLNRPLLSQLALGFGWGERMRLDTLASHGHLFCSDVFLSFSCFPPAPSETRVLLFAAGMGLTLAAVWLERGDSPTAR